MRKTFILLLAITFLFALDSCKRGCRDAAATNYDEKARINEGCIYYQTVQVTAITLLNYPNVNSSANPWDSGDNPDCFIRLVDGTNILYQSDKFDDVTSPVTWTFSPVLTIDDEDGFEIQLRDYDTDFTDSGSEKMVSDFIYMTNYTSSPGTVNKDAMGKYPNMLEINEGGATLQINLNWQL
jgi:hypothetical protein